MKRLDFMKQSKYTQKHFFFQLIHHKAQLIERRQKTKSEQQQQKEPELCPKQAKAAERLVALENLAGIASRHHHLLRDGVAVLMQRALGV